MYICQLLELSRMRDHIAPTAAAAATAFIFPQCRIGKLVQRISRFGKSFIPAIDIPPISTRGGEYAYCHFPLLMEKNTARSEKRFCSDKGCGRPIVTNDEE